jgi:hypothetical protein
MHTVICVEPMAEGCAFRQPAEASPQVFASGAKAQDAALQLGARVAEAGQTSEVVVYLRGGALGGRFICRAGEPPAAGV